MLSFHYILQIDICVYKQFKDNEIVEVSRLIIIMSYCLSRTHKLSVCLLFKRENVLDAKNECEQNFEGNFCTWNTHMFCVR